MTLHWMFIGRQSSLEQTLKHSIPGCLILMDLFLNSIPLYICHAFYPVIVHLIYLAVVTLSLYLAYTIGHLDKTIPFPSNPTVLIGGHALLPNGYQDFSNISRIFIILLGAIFIGIMIHCILLTLVITRDFLASLCHQSTNIWYDSNDDIAYLMDNSTTTLDPISRQSSSAGIMSGRGKGGKAKTKSARADLQFPVGRVHRLLRKGNYAERVGAGAPVYLAAVLEYLAAEVLE
ncbi:putative histone H2A [Schistosoma mansoni]|uniref:putative histone H2A n=1 Tax=Schistosoma mansoni TaxID=6183 RepID=UPI0001A62FC3|nr:putative histone H2A [Schistosoma mansoni]|eukprot:XP_018652240.1 putative histone H2A [Schistosoma mansoni]